MRGRKIKKRKLKSTIFTSTEKGRGGEEETSSRGRCTKEERR